jgi:hypothetical protein
MTNETLTLFKAVSAKTLPVASPQDIFASQASTGVLLLEDLIAPAIAGDWAEWLAQFHALENTWFAPLLQALQTGQLDKLSLMLSHNTTISSHAVGKSSLHKFWRAPSLARLAT